MSYYVHCTTADAWQSLQYSKVRPATITVVTTQKQPNQLLF